MTKPASYNLLRWSDDDVVPGIRSLQLHFDGVALDQRSALAALIAAALAAEGESRVSPLETVERGYAQIVDRLKALGASVSRLA